MTTDRVIAILDQVDAEWMRNRIDATDAELEEMQDLGWIILQANDGLNRHISPYIGVHKA